jgi:hypothetical protein
MDEMQPGYQSVLSQLTSVIVGQGVIYFIAIGSLLAVLCLSANTSFVDFPRLCRLVARDGYLPRSFATPGRRLVYSVGVIMAGGSGRTAAHSFRRDYRPADPVIRCLCIHGLHAVAAWDGFPLDAPVR